MFLSKDIVLVLTLVLIIWRM